LIHEVNPAVEVLKRAVAPVAVWGLGLLLRGELVDDGKAPDNADSQGG